MRAEEQIRKALRRELGIGAANACQVFKGYAYGINGHNVGWHYTPFNGTPIFLGSNLRQALEVFKERKR